MSKIIPDSRMRLFAQQFVAHEAHGTDPSKLNLFVVSRVLVALRRPLRTLAGVSGFRVLPARALTLTIAPVPAFSAVKVEQDALLIGLDELRDHNNPEDGISRTNPRGRNANV